MFSVAVDLDVIMLWLTHGSRIKYTQGGLYRHQAPMDHALITSDAAVHSLSELSSSVSVIDRSV